MRALTTGLWVEASAEAPGTDPIYTKITAADAASGLVTFADEIMGLGAGARVRVLATYGTQPDLKVVLPSPLLAIGGAVVYLDVWEIGRAHV